MSVEELINAMLAGFEGGARWCQGEMSVDAQGELTTLAKADRFCLLGMRNRIFAQFLPLPGKLALWEAFETRFTQVTGSDVDGHGHPNVAGWNDSRINFGEVKSVLERMLEEVK